MINIAEKEIAARIHELRYELGMPWADIVAIFPDVPRASLRRIASRERKRLGLPPIERPQKTSGVPLLSTAAPQHKVEFTQGENEATAQSTSTRIKTLPQLLEAAEVDLTIWRVNNWTANSWEQHSVAMGMVTLHQVKAYLVRNKEAKLTQYIEDLREEARQFAPVYPPLPPITPPVGGHMLEISIPDLHYGKFAWPGETGGQVYDMETAESLFRWAARALLNRGRRYDLDEIVFVLGNDLFNADNTLGTTTAGTPQDVIGSHRQHFRQVRHMVQEIIDELQQVAPVHVYMVSGNHDKETIYYLGEALEDWYWKCDRVTVHNDPPERQYHQYGRVLLGFTHGDEIKPDKLPMVMASESPDAWAASTFHEWHIGHGHRKREYHYLPVFEENGVRVRAIPSLCAADKWHYDRSFNKGLRSAEAYIWHPETGMDAMYSANLNKMEVKDVDQN